MTNLTTRRTLLGTLIAACLLHVWAYFAPQTWYETFPGIGRGWLLRLGPYSEHLVTDMAALYMAMLVVTIAAWRFADDDRYVRTVGGAWLAFNCFHLLYHLRHLSMYSPGERVAIVGLLSALTVISAVLLIPSPRVHRKPLELS
ncbi:unnamed protein product [[Actinomadura] parvosata subsp. kistnae]|uniref:hypothetical protein n=1 Tax=[Actinomadura] parvosata TaxID=1955412 RepID=UPI000D29196F|nr:hypothetical protein [Nonomuraea sp. ATCC 55076]SPL94304.1 unnamed protein product [Actinomadura parvosata subsp. kistnae]